MSKARPALMPGGRRSLAAHADDNVATVLDDHLERILIAGGLRIDPGIPFGHKVALADFAPGDPVIKYGVVIGHAKSAIRQGEHVHVHNIA